MKVIDKYILKEFVKTFASLFIILYFIFILQGLWMHISDLAGKDLGLDVIGKFVLLISPRLIVMELPLAVLLSSIMTFGSFAEHYELTSMKSAGMSLLRIIRSVIIFILFLSLFSFWFSNNILTQSEKRFDNLRVELAEKKPAMAIKTGQFNDLNNINIKVDKKYGENKNHLQNVILHIKNSSYTKNKTVIKSTKGKISTNSNNNTLQLQLYDGNLYEEMDLDNFQQRGKMPFSKTHFKKYTINVDLSQFEDNNNGARARTDDAKMLTLKELIYYQDSINNYTIKELNAQVSNLAIKTEHITNDTATLESKSKKILTPEQYTQFGRNQQLYILKEAKANAESIIFSKQNDDILITNKLKQLNELEFFTYEKFMVAFSCILMFFIGAPLGAIIRKGGMGLPIVISVIIFLVFYFLNIFGKKFSEENGISGWLGAWIATLTLLPMAIIFTFKATKDRGINSLDNILFNIKHFFIKKIKNTKAKDE